MRKIDWFVLNGLALVACVPEAKDPIYKGQSYRDAVRTMCDADRLAGLSDVGDPIEKDRKREEFLNERIENPDAVYLHTMLKVKSAEEKAAVLHNEARECGLASCASADAIAEE